MGRMDFELEKKILDRRVPSDVTFELTNLCNLDCSMCYLPKKAGGLSTREVKDILDELVKEGCLFLTFTGGEIFLRKDILEILDYATGHGFVVTLKTNGTLIDEAISGALKELQIHEVDISILGSTASTHDEVSGVQGSFDKAVHAIQCLLKAGVRTSMMSVIMHGHIEEIEKIEKLARELGVADYNFDSVIFPKNNGDTSTLRQRLNDEELRQFFRLRRDEHFKPEDFCPLPHFSDEEKQDDLLLSCAAGRNGILIKPDGTVTACMSLPMALGNLKLQSLREILDSSQVDELVAMIRLGNNKDCSACPDRIGCFRCPGLAYLEHGNCQASPKEACRQRRIKQEVLGHRC